MRSLSFLGVSSLALSSLALPTMNQNQHRFVGLADLADEDKPQAIKDAFSHAWKGYMTYAYPMDELRPVSNGGSNPLYDILLPYFAFVIYAYIIYSNHHLSLHAYYYVLGTVGEPRQLMRFRLPSSWACQMS